MDDLHPGWIWALGIVGPTVQYLGLWAGFFALNQGTPDVAMATTWYALSIVGGGLVIAGLALITHAQKRRAPWFGFLMVIGLAPWMFEVLTTYGLLAEIGLAMTAAYILLPALLVATIWGLIIGFRLSWPQSPQPVVFLALGMCASMVIGAALVLADMPNQAAMAREAHEAPSLGLVPVLFALGLLLRRKAL